MSFENVENDGIKKTIDINKSVYMHKCVTQLRGHLDSLDTECFD